MLRKQFAIKEVSGAKGEVTAVIATLNVIDKDGDVTEPGAFGTQESPIQPAHNWSAAAIGKAKISESKEEALAEMKFNLNSASGSEWFEALKFDFEEGDAPQQEYSYGYDILDSGDGEFENQKVQFLRKLRVLEVSPVLVGAGVNTRTLAVKSGLIGRETRFHLAKQLGDLSHRQLEEALRAKLTETFGDEKTSVWIADIWETDLVYELYTYGSGEEKLYRLDYQVDGKSVTVGSEPTEVIREVNFVPAKGRTIEKEFQVLEKLLADVSGFNGRARALAAVRTKEGRTLSSANRERLSQLLSTISEVQQDISKLLAETDPEGKNAELFARFQKTQFELRDMLKG